MLTAKVYIVGFSGVKDYDMTSSGGGKGTYAKLNIRLGTSTEIHEVKCSPNPKWGELVDSEQDVEFLLKKGSVVQAQFPE